MQGSSFQVVTGVAHCVVVGLADALELGWGIRLLRGVRFGLVAGLVAGNYDIKDIFVDSILKIGGQDFDSLADMLVKLDNLSGSEVELVFTVSADAADLPDYIKKYIV